VERFEDGGPFAGIVRDGYLSRYWWDGRACYVLGSDSPQRVLTVERAGVPYARWLAAVPPIAAQIPIAGDAGERTAVFEPLRPMSVDEGALGVPIRQKNIAELDRQQDRPPDPRDDRFEAPSKRRMATKIFLRPRIFATDARTVSPGGMGGRLWIGRRLGPSPLRRKDPKTRRT
jgi:hypothetical protein